MKIQLIVEYAWFLQFFFTDDEPKQIIILMNGDTYALYFR